MAQQEDTWPLERQKLKARLLSRVRHWSAGVPLGRYFLVALRHLQEKTFTNDMRQCSPKCRQIKKIPRSDGQMSLAGAPSKKKKTFLPVRLLLSFPPSKLPLFLLSEGSGRKVRLSKSCMDSAFLRLLLNSLHLTSQLSSFTAVFNRL